MSEGDFKMFCIRTDGSSGRNGATKAMFDAYAVSRFIYNIFRKWLPILFFCACRMDCQHA